ncbi:MAG TPA: hypothetical protein VF322_04745 [Gammaproteobacteria bacterium]
MASYQELEGGRLAQSPVVRRAISGRITIEGTDRGIPNLIVEALDLSYEGRTVRIASVSTDGTGTFRIEAPAPAGDGGRSWDLQVVVLAPERANRSRKDRQLYASETREHAGQSEFFRIELPADALKAAGIDAQPAANVAASDAASAIRASQVQTEQIQAATEKVFEARIDTVAARRTLFRDEVRQILANELSTVSDKERASGRFVPDAGRIEAIHHAAIKTDLAALTATVPDPRTGAPVRQVRLRGRLQLTREQRQALSAGGNQPVELTEAQLEDRLGFTLDKPPVVYRLHLEPDPCRPLTDAERCLEDGETESDDGTDDGGGAAGPIDGPDVNEHGDVAGGNVRFRKGAAIARIMGRQSAPEDPVVFGSADGDLEGRLGADEVSTAINQIVFTPGPADVPAFYDFHDLQIAFEPVWQEALDDRYLKDVEAAYDQIVERGGAPAVTRVRDLVTAHRASGLFGRFFDDLFDDLFDIGTAASVEVPAAVVSAVMISVDEWQALPAGSRNQLLALANRIAVLREKLIEALDPENVPEINLLGVGDMIRAINTRESIAIRSQIQILTSDAERIVAHARRLLIEREANMPFKPTHAIIEELRRRRSEAYPFRYFAASPRYRSVNFGIMVTYRQKWTPVSYQVGELVSTIPLAPAEVRKFSRKTVVKRSRSQKEIESNLISRSTESQETSRAEAEIVARATAKTSFTRSHSGTVNIGENAVGGSNTMTTTFTRDAEKHSASVKREFREAILKSAEEYKNERKIEISTEESFEEEVTESGEIRNPNDEIPVTFLFYELQRRFKVSEKLHRLQSVVLVAQEVPSPSEIDVPWLIRHDWILNRVLLDDSFRPALAYASTTLISEEAALKEMRDALFRQRTLVEELKEEVADRRALAGLRYAALQRQIERTAESADSGGILGGLGDLFGSIPIAGDLVQGGLDLLTGGGDGPSEAAQLREGASRDAFERENREAEEMASRLANALATLQAMQSAYTERLAQHLRQLAQVERLIAHIVQNIMPYMQAIWAYEPNDQRFLRLRNVPVPVFEKDKSLRRYLILPARSAVFRDRPPVVLGDYEVLTDVAVAPPASPQQEIKTKPLSEVADINRPLGCIGNYLILPMFESNPITEFMMDPYVTVAEGEYGASDPDPLGNMTLEEFGEYVCCLKRYFGERAEAAGEGGEAPPDPFDELKPYLRATLKKLLQLSLRDDEEVIVPTGSLYIEALPGAHSVMEQFKHLHRQIDVKIAQSRLRQLEIDNIRQAQRILDDMLEDPNIEAKYVFEGDGSATVVPPAGPGGGTPPSG